MKGIKSSDVIQALSTLSASDTDKQKERELLERLRSHERLNIDTFFSPRRETRKTTRQADRQLMLYLKVRPRRLRPLFSPSNRSSEPTPPIPPEAILQSLQKPKPKAYKEQFRIYSEWEYHMSNKMQKEPQNHRFKAIQSMKNLHAYKSNQPAAASSYETWLRDNVSVPRK